jgi:hypothetical protein
VFGIAAASMSLLALWVWGRWLRSLLGPDHAMYGGPAPASVESAAPLRSRKD